MKKVLLLSLLAVIPSLMVQGQTQAGIPAKITAVNGKEFPVFLQDVKDDRVIFQLYRRPANQSAPIKAVAKIEFVGRFDVEAAEQSYNAGDYQGMILKMKADLKPSLDDYWSYMSVENNLQGLFAKLMDAYLRLGDSSGASRASTILLQSGDESITGQAQAVAILVALAEERIEDAEALVAEVKSDAGRLYLGACVQRAKNETAAAFRMTNQLIKQYGNDLDWMPQTELLNAHLYLDSGITNSAINTARQVKNFYRNSAAGSDAAKLHAELVLEKQKYDAVVKAREEAAAAAREEVKARAAERAKGHGFGTGTETDGEETEPEPADGTDMEEQDGEEL